MIVVTGILAGADGYPLKQAIIECVSTSNAGASFIHAAVTTKTDDAGFYHFELQTGEYNVYAQVNRRSDISLLGPTIISDEMTGTATLNQLLAFATPISDSSVVEVRNLTAEARHFAALAETDRNLTLSAQEQSAVDATTSREQAMMAGDQAILAQSAAEQAETSKILAHSASTLAKAHQDTAALTQQRCESARDAAISAASAAQDSATTSAHHQTVAQSARLQIETIRDEAASHAMAAADDAALSHSHAVTASSAADSALSSRDIAIEAKDFAAQSEANALRYRNEAVVARDVADIAEASAVSASAMARDSAASASSHRQTAEQAAECAKQSQQLTDLTRNDIQVLADSTTAIVVDNSTSLIETQYLVLKLHGGQL